MAFTRKAAKEARQRAQERFHFSEKEMPWFRTIHSLAFRQLGLRRHQILKEDDYVDIADRVGFSYSATKKVANDEDNPLFDFESNDANQMFFIENFARVSECSIEEVWRDRFMSHPDIQCSFADVLRLQGEITRYKANRGLVDFTDVLTEFIADGARPPVTHVIVDEGQDLSRVQWRVIEKISADAEHTTIAGDDDQCSIQGTLIDTTKGPVEVSQLDPAVHRLLSYSKEDAAVYGQGNSRNGTQGYKFNIKARPYSGSVIRVSAADKSTVTTPNHTWLVKWDRESNPNAHCVYLMRRGDWFRVGWCQLFTVNGSSHFGTRCRMEKADEAWMLKVYSTRQEASAMESIVAATFGISTATFEPLHGATLYTRELLDAVFQSIPDQEARGHSALAAFDKDPRFPLWSDAEVRTKRSGSQIFQIAACNLVDGLMKVPVRDGTHVNWCRASIQQEQYTGLVFGLEVEKYHTYIADGIVTHNCIFKWAGADVETFLGLHGRVTVLNQSYRVPFDTWDLARRLSALIKLRRQKQFSPRIGAQGTVQMTYDLGDLGHADAGKGRWLFLCRHVYQISKLEAVCRDKGWFFESGWKRSNASPNARAVIAWENIRRGSLAPAPDVLRAFELAHLNPGTLREYPAAADVSRGDAFFKRVKLTPWTEWHFASTPEGEYLAQARRAGEKMTTFDRQIERLVPTEPRIKISTIHGAKGGESSQDGGVYLLSDITQRTYDAMQHDLDNELRVFYVGITRTAGDLVVGRSENKYTFEPLESLL